MLSRKMQPEKLNQSALNCQHCAINKGRKRQQQIQATLIQFLHILSDQIAKYINGFETKIISSPTFH
jgi:cytochrome c